MRWRLRGSVGKRDNRFGSIWLVSHFCSRTRGSAERRPDLDSNASVVGECGRALLSDVLGIDGPAAFTIASTRAATESV
jgi:hypothetical protein